MLAHPLVATVLLCDTLAVVLLVPAVLAAIRIVLGWAPERSDAAQLRREAAAESASVLARYATGCLLVGSLCLVVAITAVLPRLVPGAMCGTGVIQAMGGRGQRMLLLRGLSIALLAGWHLVDRLNRSHPHAPLTVASARGLLLAAPFVLLAVTDTLRALWGVDPSQPVDCCAVIYDQVRQRSGGAPLTPAPWVPLSGLGAALLVVLALWLRRRSSSRGSSVLGATVAVVALGWAPLATLALIERLAAYHYHVLHHRCPWCLFLGEHQGVGSLLFGALGVVMLEGLSSFLATRVAARCPAVAVAARARTRAAASRIVVAVVLFWVVAGTPAVLWRIRFGTWMGG